MFHNYDWIYLRCMHVCGVHDGLNGLPSSDSSNDSTTSSSSWYMVKQESSHETTPSDHVWFKGRYIVFLVDSSSSRYQQSTGKPMIWRPLMSGSVRSSFTAMKKIYVSCFSTFLNGPKKSCRRPMTVETYVLVWIHSRKWYLCLQRHNLKAMLA